jgi:hypothetical protein
MEQPSWYTLKRAIARPISSIRRNSGMDAELAQALIENCHGNGEGTIGKAERTASSL